VLKIDFGDNQADTARNLINQTPRGLRCGSEVTVAIPHQKINAGQSVTVAGEVQNAAATSTCNWQRHLHTYKESKGKAATAMIYKNTRNLT